jgi:ribonucleotide reductase alpha subunit
VTFHLDAEFIAKYVGQQPKWGPIGYVTYKRTYARDLDKIYPRHRALGEAAGLVDNEEFWLTLVRVTEGTVGIIADHCRALRLPWDLKRAQQTGQEMYRLMWEFKYSPPGRGLWMMGAPIVEKIGSACLNNCAFLSSKDIDVDFSGPFCALMDFSMLGVGVGGDTRGAGKVTILKPEVSHHAFTVDDSREGWVEVLRVVLDAYVGRGAMPAAFDYSEVRESGTAINGFGGTASGPGPLREMVEAICGLLDARIGVVIMSSDIVDLFNLVGRCVVAGNVRRSAELMLGEPVDEGFLELKDRDKHAAAIDSHRWASNNSILAKVGQKYDRVAKRTAKNGEPGYFWLKNAQDYGRMSDPPNYKDVQVLGTNPCITSDARVLTDEGVFPVSELINRPFVAMVDGQPWNATGFWSTGIKATLYLDTDDGRRLQATPNHEVYVDLVQSGRAGGVFGWVAMQDLRPGVDFVVLDYGRTARVLNILPAPDAEVFDCTVETVHRFVANGIVVHNCSEQSLFDRELCCLVETYPFHHDGTKDYKRTIKFAYLYAKAVTLVPTHDPKTNAVTMKNRRIGCSMSGIVQAMSKFGRRGFLDMCDEVYAYICELDKDYSGWLCVPESIKKTSVKPSGTVSLLCQATPGIHHPIAEYYWRVIRFATNSKMLPALRAAGYMTIEIDQAKEPNTTAVYFPVKEEGFERGERDVSMWEQLELTAAMQAHWADNQVSVTVKFDRETEGPQIARALELYETRLKGVAFLPHGDHGYEHAPYQPITEAEYLGAKSAIGVLDLSRTVHETTDAFCDGDKCMRPGVMST